MRFVKPTDLDATADIFAAYGARNIDHYPYFNVQYYVP